MWTIVAILVILWLLGMLTSATLGGVLHLLLVIALVIVILDLVRGTTLPLTRRGSRESAESEV